jgi:hypothetical protein
MGERKSSIGLGVSIFGALMVVLSGDVLGGLEKCMRVSRPRFGLLPCSVAQSLLYGIDSGTK